MGFNKANFVHNFNANNEKRKKVLLGLIEDFEEILIYENDFDKWIDVDKRKYKAPLDLTEQELKEHFSLTLWRCNMQNRRNAFNILIYAGVITGWKKKWLSFSKLKIKIDKEAYVEMKKTIQSLEEKEGEQKVPAYWITYKNGQILLNNVRQPIREPEFNGANDNIFQYIIDNPNKKITKDDVNKSTKVNKDLNLVMKEVGFVNELSKIFLKGNSKYAVHLRNPVFFDELEDLGIEYVEPEILVKNAHRK